MSKALLRSTQKSPVRFAGFGELKPLVMAVTKGSRAVMVQQSGLKPCWDGLAIGEIVQHKSGMMIDESLKDFNLRGKQRYGAIA